MPYAPFRRGPVYMAVAGLVAVVALIAGVLMMTDHESGRGVIFIVAAVVAAIVAVFARPADAPQLVQARALPVGASQPVAGIDAFVRDAELAQPLTLRGEVLGATGAAGLADQGLTHDRERTDSPDIRDLSPDGVSATPQVQAAVCGEPGGGVSAGGSASDPGGPCPLPRRCA
jgi:hypothetical protein